jgi:hypothetical protein
LGTLTALATTEDGLLGGAFNILDQLHNANDFIRSKAGSCGSNFVGCPNFTVAPKVAVYWEPGFNPGSYFEGSSALSFYIPGFSRLFILGGVNGDINYSDTDHFDNSVIIHEFGHFLEDSMFVSDSPGGEHNGNRVIDFCFVWFEGFFLRRILPLHVADLRRRARELFGQEENMLIPAVRKAFLLRRLGGFFTGTGHRASPQSVKTASMRFNFSRYDRVSLFGFSQKR